MLWLHSAPFQYRYVPILLVISLTGVLGARPLTCPGCVALAVGVQLGALLCLLPEDGRVALAAGVQPRAFHFLSTEASGGQPLTPLCAAPVLYSDTVEPGMEPAGR